jgi:toxin ParE1/3/4
MPVVRQREAARRDLVDHFVYLAENASLNTADRFLSNAQASFAELALQPGMGAPLNLKHPDLVNLRKWWVKDFDNHLIFYMPCPEGVTVVRILHAASDWWALLGFEG